MIEFISLFCFTRLIRLGSLKGFGDLPEKARMEPENLLPEVSNFSTGRTSRFVVQSDDLRSPMKDKILY